MNQIESNVDQDIKDNSNVLNNGVVDTDIKSSSNLLNNSDTVQDVNKKVLTTEVTSIAQEEQRTGIPINVPNEDELYSKATISFIRNMKFLNDLIAGRNGPAYKISRKGMNRVLNSILQLPMDGLTVILQGNEEKAAFAAGQRLLADRFLLTHKHIIEERKRLQKEKESANVSQQTEQQVPNTEGDKNEQVL